MIETVEEKPVATVEVIPTLDGNEINFKPTTSLWRHLINKKETELYLSSQHQPLPLPLPEVPDFVAEWFEAHKEGLEFAIFSAIVDCWKHNFEKKFNKDDFYTWLNYENNKPIETIFRMKNGYTVQKAEEVEG